MFPHFHTLPPPPRFRPPQLPLPLLPPPPLPFPPFAQMPPPMMPYPRRSRSVGFPLRTIPRRPRRTYNIRENALYSYLPVFTAKYFRSPDEADSIIDNWILGNPEISRDYWNPIQEDLLREVFYLILDAVAAADSGGEVVHSTSRRLLQELELSFHEDDRGTVLGGCQVSQNSQHMFRSLAEISHSSRSPHIGSVLLTFFLDHVRHLARRESPRALVQWCHAILRAHMREDDKCLCMETLLSLRPELIDEVDAEPGKKARRVAECLSGVGMDIGYSGRISDGLRRPRSRRRARFEDIDDRDEYLELDREDERYIRRLKDDVRFHEDAADRGREKMLRLEIGSHGARRLTMRDELDDLRLNSRRSERLLRERDSLESIRWASRRVGDDALLREALRLEN